MDLERAKRIFEQALEAAASERDALVRLQCSDDQDLCDLVLGMLQQHEADTARSLAGGPLGVHEDVPERLGQYRILGELGRGNMGVVYEAEQDSPRRRVALKVINAGALSARSLRRFEYEADILGRLQHAGIAQVFEAGTFENPRGRQPFFAMELIKGRRLSVYIQEERPSTRRRLELLVEICKAVQHAHGRGVIHRDLKPDNILVADDGQPKVLDFGVARATDSDIKATTDTDVGRIIGTLAYMSPEQARGNPAELDNRTDVYALGVIAYELLADRLPYDLRQRALLEAVRVINEEEPDKLSITNRTLRGDVEVIVGKALEKDKNRRYETAEALAADIERYMSDEPITARPPSTWYQVSKFSRRNKGLVGGVIAAFLMLVAGLATTLWQADKAKKQATRADERAEQLKRVAAFQEQMLSQVDPTTAGIWLTECVRAKYDSALAKDGESDAERAKHVEEFIGQWRKVNATDTAIEIIDRTVLRPSVNAIDRRFGDQAALASQLRQVLADRYRELGRFADAMPLQVEALITRRRVLGEENADTLMSLNNTGVLLHAQGHAIEGESYCRRALYTSYRILGEDHQDTLTYLNVVGMLLREQGRLPDAEPYIRQALEGRRRVLTADHADTLRSINDLGFLLLDLGNLAEAEQCFCEALEARRRVLGNEHPDTLESINNFGRLLQERGRLSEAEQYFREGFSTGSRILGEDHPYTRGSLNNLGVLLWSDGRLTDAKECFQEVLDRDLRTMGLDHPDTLQSINNIGVLLRDSHEPDRSKSYLIKAVEGRRRVLGSDHPDTLQSINNMALLLCDEGKFDEAEALLRQVVVGYERKLGQGHYRTGNAKRKLGCVLVELNRFAEAEAELIEAERTVSTPDNVASGGYKQCVGALIALYDAWDVAQPGNDYDVKAALWRERASSMNKLAPTAPSTGTLPK